MLDSMSLLEMGVVETDFLDKRQFVTHFILISIHYEHQGITISTKKCRLNSRIDTCVFPNGKKHISYYGIMETLQVESIIAYKKVSRELNSSLALHKILNRTE